MKLFDHYYHLDPGLIKEVLNDETMPEVDRVVKLAIISLYGSSAAEQIAKRTMLIGEAIAETNRQMEKKYANG